jgi:hypothetical protein
MAHPKANQLSLGHRSFIRTSAWVRTVALAAESIHKSEPRTTNEKKRTHPVQQEA